MRIIAALLVIGLSGCAHTPWADNFARQGAIPPEYRADKSQCHDQAWAAAKAEASSVYSGVFPYFFGKIMTACMKDKGYEKVDDTARVHSRASNQEIQVGRK